MKAAAYIRVSTERQADEGTSLESQREDCLAFISQKGWDHVGTYEDDESGTKESREDLDRLLADCHRGAVEAVVFYNVKRAARSRRAFYQIVDTLEEAGATYVFLDMPAVDTSTPTGKLMAGLLALLAQWDRDVIVEQTSRGVWERARAGFWPGGPAPFGHELTRPTGAGKQSLAVDEAEAEVLREAARLIVDEDQSTWEAAKVLNAKGLLPRGGQPWKHNHLRRVLLADNLSGRWVYKSKRGEAELELPPVMPPDRHAAVLAKLRATSSGPRASQRFYELSRGRLLAVCGAPYFGLNRKAPRAPVYRCNNRHQGKCDCHNLHAEMVEEMVWSEVTALLSDRDRLLRMSEEYFDLEVGESEDSGDRIEAVDTKLAELGRKRTTEVRRYVDAGVDPAVLKGATAEWAEEEAALRAHRARLEAALEQAEEEADRALRIKQLAEQAELRLAQMKPRERRQVYDLLDVRVQVVDWTDCEACGGSGKVPGTRGLKGCPDCHAMQRTPRLQIQGTVFDDLDLEAGATSSGDPKRSTCCRR